MKENVGSFPLARSLRRHHLIAQRHNPWVLGEPTIRVSWAVRCSRISTEHLRTIHRKAVSRESLRQRGAIGFITTTELAQCHIDKRPYRLAVD